MMGEKFFNWLSWLVILFTVMYFGAHLLAYLIYSQGY